MKNILLIGGRGFIGSHIQKALSAHNEKYNIKILSRQNTHNNQFIKADLLNLNDLIQVFTENKIDYIIQSVQFKGHPVERPWMGDNYTYAFDSLATKNILKAIKYTSSKIEQYIYLSGAGVNLPYNYSWLNAKRQAEKAIQESLIPFTILRPSWVYGQGDQSMSKFVFFAKYLPFFPIIGDGQNPINPLWVEDLAEIIINSIQNPLALNQIIELGSSEITMKEIAETLLELTNQKKPLLYHPIILMKFIGLFSQFIPISPISPDSIDFLTMNAELPKIQKEILNIKIKSLREGLKASLLI